jgi:MYXO-CTERM domain-containing protein
MRLSKLLLLSVPALALSLSEIRDAAACGGCFGPPPEQESEATQVTGHRMILSVSKTQTTLWDQITYSGAPSSFGWVLPIKGMVDVGLSSDALFQNLDADTQVTVTSPQINCPPPPFCGGSGATGSGDFGEGTGGGGGGGPPPVTVTAQAVVGPYETVQLHSTDPAALKTWLSDHGYNLPVDVAPVIDAYVGDGFDFLALKLVPGQGISAMRPVRVTSQGASPVLPLRMVAAGTGAITPVTLYVLAEGRYEPSNMPSFSITSDQVVWNWDSQSSNYAALKQAGFDQSQGKAWLVEAGEPFSSFGLTNALTNLAQSDPVGSGYADDMGMGAIAAAGADLDTLFAGLDSNSVWVTRLHGELSRAALADDMTLGASNNQSPVERFLFASKTAGTAPTCPSYPPCDNSSSASGGGSTNLPGNPGGWTFQINVKGGSSNGSCAMNPSHDWSTSLGALSALAALAFLRRRRR